MNNQKQSAALNFKKAHSHIARILKMIENEQYCVDIMQQNLAVIGLLRSAHRMLMENHLNTCFKSAMASQNKAKKEAMTQEILQVTQLYNK